jgi:hypothetical protein
MGAVEQARVRLAGQRERRVAVRRIAAALCIGCSVVYLAIGLGLVQVSEPVAGNDILVFGVAAGLAFVLGAVLLSSTDRLGPWIAGAVFQVAVIVMYVVVSGQRTPPFELWGLLLKVAQVGILAALLYLIVSPGGRCPCAYCEHHRNLHHGRCFVPACPCGEFL